MFHVEQLRLKIARAALRVALPALEADLLAIADEKNNLKDHAHVDSDCGFELLHRLKGGAPTTITPKTFIGDEMRPLTYAAVDATMAARNARIEGNQGKGFRCTNCADTRVVPAPEPYGSWGCTWPCPDCCEGDGVAQI